MNTVCKSVQMKKIRKAIDQRNKMKDSMECGNFGAGLCCNKGTTGHCCNK